MASGLVHFLVIMILSVVAVADDQNTNFPSRMPSAIYNSLPELTAMDMIRNVDTTWADSGDAIMEVYEGKPGKCKDDPYADTVTSRFFLHEDLKMNAQLRVHLKSAKNGGISTKFVAAELIKKLPAFNSSMLTENMDFFSIDARSNEAKVMELSLNICEKQSPINGKWQHCATSLGDLVSHVRSTLTNSHVKVISPMSSNEGLTAYTVEAFAIIARGESMIACHKLGFPYAVFYCHQPHGTTTYSLSLARLSDGQRINALAICHDDTSAWSNNYLGFKVLKVRPGTALCHFLQYSDLVWYK